MRHSADVQIFGTGNFRGRFSEPAAILVDPGVNPDKIDAGQIDLVAFFIHGPADVERTQFIVIHVFGFIGMVVGISPVVSDLNIKGRASGYRIIVVR